MNAKIATKRSKTGGTPYWPLKTSFHSLEIEELLLLLLIIFNKASILARASLSSFCKTGTEFEREMFSVDSETLNKFELFDFSFSLEIEGAIESDSDNEIPFGAIKSFCKFKEGATGDEIGPELLILTPPPKPEPEPSGKTHFKRYFLINSSGQLLNWELKSDSEAISKVGTTFMRNFSVFFDSDNRVTKN